MTEGQTRPTVDVVVPFKGTQEALRIVRERLAAVALRAGDSVLVVDNTPDAAPPPDGDVAVIQAPDIPTPAFARNRGAERGDAEWIVFCDADTAPAPDLLDRYFQPPPAAETALLAGGVIEEEPEEGGGLVPRYAYLRRALSQDDTFAFGEWGYPKSANIACRRTAFEDVGGFAEGVRAAEDADLTYRLRAGGWGVERREPASVTHTSRTTLRGLVLQQLHWGAGGAWVARKYPGSVPLIARTGLARWAVQSTLRGVVSAARKRDRDAVIFAILRPLDAIAWDLGRLLPNERPLPEKSVWRRLGL